MIMLNQRTKCENIRSDCISDVIERKPILSPFFKQCTVATAVLLNNIVHGCGLAYAAVLLPQLRRSSIKLSQEEESWLASIMAPAMCAGNLLTVPAMRRGRRLTHYLVSLLNIAGWLTITLANNFQVLMTGRFLQGMSIGLFIPVIAVILGEYTSPSHRGIFLATISFGQALGVFFEHVVGSFLVWQDMALLCSFLSLVSFAITIFTPESPSWLALKGRYEECRKAFRLLRGKHEEDELNKMITASQHFEKSANDRVSVLRAMTKREVYIPLVIGVMMYVIVINCGSMVLANYVNEIVEELMGPDCNVVAWMGALDGVRLASNSASLYLVGRLKRRTLLFSTGVACVVAHGALSAYIYAKTSGLIDAHIWVPALVLTCQVVTLGLGAQSVPFMILGEIFPLQYRGLCGFVCNLALVTTMFIVLKTFPALRAGAGLGGAWLVYGAAVALALAVAWRLLPETRGRTLQDIEEQFRGKPSLPKHQEIEALSRNEEENL